MDQSTGRGAGRVIGDYSVGRQLGSGSFSVVWHGRHRVHGTEVAIKEIAMDRLNKKLQESLKSEIFILKQINHPNIVKLHDIIEASGRIHLVLEYCRGGDLNMYIQRYKRVPEATAKHFMLQLAAGLKILRENNLIHRDLKPQNLLVSSNDENSVLKIADFGFARSLQPRGLAETMCGSPLYMAPEIMQLQKYDAKADLWSVGAILFQLVTGATPFTGSNPIQLLQNIIRSTELRFPADIMNLSPQCMDLCKKLLRRNPVERLTFDEFFNHPFLSNIQPDEIYSPSKSIEGSSPDDCLPFLLDDDSSGPDGSPSYFRRSSIMSSEFSPHIKRDAIHSASKNSGISSRSSTISPHVKNSGFRIDNRAMDVGTKIPARQVEQRVTSSLARDLKHPHVISRDTAGGALELIDQDYVLVPESIAEIPSSSVHISKSRQFSNTQQSTSIRCSNATPKASAPMLIVGASTRDPCPLGSLESQCSDPPGTSQGSTDFGDTSEQQSANLLTRINSLQKCAATIKELVDEKTEAGKYLDAFSVQLIILAIWKQSLHICHAQAVSSREGSPSPGHTKVSTEYKHDTPDSHESLGIGSSRDLEDVSSEIKRDFLKEVGLAEELSKFVEPGNTEMPDAMETIYQSALALGRNGAVDELMGDVENAALSYSKATQLLVFLLVEAPSLLLNPPFSLTSSDRFRLRTYINILSKAIQSPGEWHFSRQKTSKEALEHIPGNTIPSYTVYLLCTAHSFSGRFWVLKCTRTPSVLGWYCCL
ncbi:LOW QUALITY PROTEIN: hypothetical protein V2J09_006671 [Rumex salicifolius]